MRPSLLLCALLLAACGDTIVNVPDSSRSSVSPTAPAVVNTRVEYRVSGNANSVRLKYFNTNDGIIQVVTTLPYSTTFITNQDTLFLSLEVTPVSYSTLVAYPFLSAQIFINGSLFRETTSNEFLLNTIAVTGTWRK